MLRFDVDVTASSVEKRTISGIAVPFDRVATLNDKQYAFGRGSLAKGRAVTPLLLDHDSTRPVGVLADMTDGEDGVEATFRIDPTPEGDAALATAASGSRGGLSVGVNVVEADDVEGVQHVKAASLMEISLCAIPAFADAQVTTVTASEDSPNDPIRGESDTPESTKEVEMDSATPEVVAEEPTEVIIKAEAPAPKISAGEFVVATVKSQRGDRAAADVLAALDQNYTPDASGVMPMIFENQILERTSNPRTLYGAFSKRAMPSDSKEATFPREDPLHNFEGWRQWDASAPSARYTIGVKTIGFQPYSHAVAIHQDVQNRSIIDFIEYTYGRMVDTYYGNVEVRLSDTLAGAASSTHASMAEAVTEVWKNGRTRGFAPSLIISTPEYWQHLVEADGTMKYSGGSASASPYAGTIAGLPLLISPMVDTNYVVNTSAITWMESDSFRLSAANVSALELEIAMTKYTGFTVNHNPQVADSGGRNPGDVDYVSTFDDDVSLAIASFDTPTP